MAFRATPLTRVRTSTSILNQTVCSTCRSRLMRREWQLLQHLRQARQLSATSSYRSGHSKWATIKHDKAKNDRAKMKDREQHAREIAAASRQSGPDPTTNSALALAIQRAKKNSFPKASIEAAIARGQGRSMSGAKLEPFVEEALMPPSAAMLIDCLTDNKVQTQMELRKIIKTFGGKPSSTAYLFDKQGQIIFETQAGIDSDVLLDAAIEAGALDIEQGPDSTVVYTEIADLSRITDALTQQLGAKPSSTQIVWVPAEMTGSGDAEMLELLIDKLTELPAVQGVYCNAAIDPPSP